MQPTQENWLPVVGYEGLYEVSDLGRVRSLRSGHLLKMATNRGYPRVGLNKDGNARAVRVHILVAAAFIGPRPDGQEVCHANGVKTDNRVTNLRYDTHAENNRDIVRHGHHFRQQTDHCPYGHPYDGHTGVQRTCSICRRKAYQRYNEKVRARRMALSTDS